MLRSPQEGKAEKSTWDRPPALKARPGCNLYYRMQVVLDEGPMWNKPLSSDVALGSMS
jgi:hypothetical protein